MAWLPRLSALVENVAVPDNDSVPVPRVMLPSLKVTDVPVGGITKPVTVAVKVID